MLFLTSLVPNLALGIQDIFSDAYLSTEYYNNWKNETHTNETEVKCNEFLSNATSSNRTELGAFAACLDSQSKFYYTIGFLLLSLVFYLTEFLVLDLKYEPTGLRNKISVSNMLYDVS